MSSLLPDRTARPNSRGLLETVRTAMADYCTSLSRMPHVGPGSVRLPPPEGWSDVDIGTLKSRGKTDDAIELIRHLPCLAQKTFMTQNTVSIDYSRGETCPAWAEAFIQTPGHVIWTGAQDSRDGLFLLLDTLNGTITQFGTVNDICCLPYEEYESLPPGDKWMAHPTMSAEEWFTKERLRIENLIYMTVPDTNSGPPQYYFRAKLPEDEDDIISGAVDNDDDYLESSDDSDTDGSDGAGSEDEDSLMTEVQDLGKEDAGLARPPSPFDADAVDQTPETGSDLHPSPYRDVQPGTERPEVDQVFAIYTRNGWFTGSWDREACKNELIRWAQEKKAARREAKDAKRKAKKPDDEATKQARLEQHLRIKRLMAEK